MDEHVNNTYVRTYHKLFMEHTVLLAPNEWVSCASIFRRV